MPYNFEWDEEKAKSNWIKHGVSFDEATTIFDDPLARIFDDELHSTDERREIIIGRSLSNRLVVVCFTERSNERIQIINARLRTPKEQKAYEENVDF